MFALKRDSIIPGCGMQKLSLVFVKPWDCRPSPVIQNTAGIDEYIAVRIDFLASRKILNNNVIATYLIVPIRTRNEMLCLDILTEIVFLRKIVEICVDLSAGCINSGPVCLWLKTPRIIVGWHITCTSGGEIGQNVKRVNPSECEESEIFWEKAAYPGYLFSHHVPDTSVFFS